MLPRPSLVLVTNPDRAVAVSFLENCFTDTQHYDNIGFIFWSIEALNRDGQWEIVGYATTAVVGGDVVKYIETVGFATVRYNDENPWAILETFDAV